MVTRLDRLQDTTMRADARSVRTVRIAKLRRIELAV